LNASHRAGAGLPRRVLLHYHLFKNAGSTIDSALEREFGSTFAAHDHPDETAVLPTEYVRDWLLEHPEVRALSTHQSTFPVPSAPALDVTPLIFFRHPIDRAGSLYAYERQLAGDAPGTQIARTNSFVAYVRWRFSDSATQVLTNFQVRYVAGVHHFGKGEIDQTQLDLALERLRSCTIVGTVERLDESLAYAETVLEPLFGFVDLSYRAQNVSRGRESNVDLRLRSIRQDLGPELFAELLEKNALDMELHQAATNLLMTRIRQTPRFADLLADFRRRCQARRAA
jgi:hypothetical protein